MVQKKAGIRKGNYRKSVTTYGRSESWEKHNCAAIREITEIHSNAVFRRLQRLVTILEQFTVEVDGAAISEISKFNYLLELVKGKPKEDILGLPHTEDGYGEAKRILEQTYGKDIKVHKALIKEMEELPAIFNIHKIAIISITGSQE